MIDRHWFDALSVALTRDGSSRRMLLAAGGLVAGCVLGDASLTTAKGKKKNRKRKKDKPKPKPKPTPSESCSGGACAVEPQWVGNDREINYCELICRQCDGGDPRDFCIAEEAHTGDKVAVCCAEGSKCCGSNCTDTQIDNKNCKTCGNACADGQDCRGGECVCVPEDCPHGQLCYDNQCGCGPFFKYCPNLNGGVCASPDAVC